MIRYFCDWCGGEITDENALKDGTNKSRLATDIVKHGLRFGVEVLTSANGTTNAGLFCKYCVLDALYKLDDRPRAQP